MYKHVLIPTDGSQVGTKAAAHGIALAKATGAKVTILTVMHPFHVLSLSPEIVTETAAEHSRHDAEHKRADNELEDLARSSGVPCEHVEAESDHLSEAVVQAAKSRGCDLIVMPAHERYGLLSRSIDSETVKLLTRSELPVLVMH